MFWFNNLALNPSPKERGFLFTAFMLVMVLSISSCKPNIKEHSMQMKYFDIAGYFKANASKYKTKVATITKTVYHNGQNQTNKVRIANWSSELDAFITSDINKPAWRDAYTVQTGENLTIYVAKLPELKTREIIIKQTGNQVNWIQIYNHTKNALYEDIEALSFFPDSLYTISKTQQVRLLGKNLYYIKGALN